MPEIHLPCEDCGSKDALTLYDDGHTYCFSCGTYHKTRDDKCDNPFDYDRNFKVASKAESKNKPMLDLTTLKCVTIKDRGLFKDTCEKYGYYLTDKGSHVALYKDVNGEVVGQKVRTVEPKGFYSLGKNISDYLYGMELWNGGKKLVITEGEIDCLSYAQAIDCKWPVVSVPNGAQGAKRTLLKNLDYLKHFEEIILMFDNDEPGIQAAKECAEALAGSKVSIARLPCKDANEMLMAGRVSELRDAVWKAHLYTPQGIVRVEEVIKDLFKDPVHGFDWCFPSLTNLTYGRQKGSTIGIGAATAGGKTDFLNQQAAYDLIELGLPVGIFSFEQRVTMTIKRIASKIVGERLYLSETDEDKARTLEVIDTFQDRLFLFDCFGTANWLDVESSIRYLHGVFNVEIFYIDNLTFLSETGNQKDSLENIMKRMAALANSLEIVIIFVSHLSTPPDGKSHENGYRVSGRDFKDSRTIQQLAHLLIALERDQQAENEYIRNVSTIRILKDRLTGGSTGQTLKVYYSHETGLMTEVANNENYGFTVGD